MTHVLLNNEKVPADDHVGLVDHVCENLWEQVEMQIVHPLSHDLSVNFQAFHIEHYQMPAGAEGLNDTEHRRGGDNLTLQVPFPGATSSP